ncbi:ATP-binding protein [Gillisia sp. M10.2A]|uniref:ATP-binding protein n=1 Tax=Gillisia lutea TaxID=2909668 RepID=A0ABS9EG91_9FLAO|nr:ATP-binding protein [Gillisia lutea]MCF4101882.1 ATP-binding protein [Gillisia lutea]
MIIPSEFKKILEKNQKLNGIVDYTLSQFGTILRENNLYFFEEYTDHGIQHVESVLESTVRITPAETIDSFLKEDSSSIAIYILGTILHDIGMHLTPAGFYKLISGENDDLRIIEIDLKTWKELWNDYLDEARRFGDNEKKKIFGNKDWIFRVPEIDNKDKLTGEDKKLIGEFIRRHHPRIAHEIGLKGFPVQDGYISFASELDFELRNLSGLLARSHGLNIRSLFYYLENKFQDTWSKPFNIEIIYLMVLLRISDYFQIDVSRTPNIIVKLKSFNSPVSQNEFFKHLDVKYVQPFNKDPETLVIHCEPRNSSIFIKLKELFSDIQMELDTSWAVLGEIYGKDSQEKQPKLAFRRIKANIDNTKEYSKKVNYIPEKIVFNVSNELPKLLIGPLYGNDPTYGVRELLQNAVDSCREREFLEGSKYKGEVKISFYQDEEEYFFKIDDNGLGMNLDIIKNFFLEVGSSLRKSAIWKKNFSNIEGHSKIQRSGKFGIGVLASFLIGNEIQLESRDSNSSKGLSFKTDLNSEQIEITRIDKDSVGTSITIKIKKEILNEFNESSYRFDKWYKQDNPKVTFIDKTDSFSKLGVKNKTPGFSDALSKIWREFKDVKYNKIIWTYDSKFCKGDSFYRKQSQKTGKFIVNGILIPEIKRFGFDEVSLPYISVFDFDGNLPLSLSRNNLDGGNIPFKKQLLIEIHNDIIAKLLCIELSLPTDLSEFESKTFYHPAIGSVDLILSKEGYILRNKFFIDKNSDKTLLHFLPKKKFNKLKDFDLKNAFMHISDPNDIAMSYYQSEANISNYNKGAKLYIDKLMYEKLFDDNYNRYAIGVKRDHKIIKSNENFVELAYKYKDAKEFELKELEENLKECNCIIESKLYDLKDHYREYTDASILKSLLDKYFMDFGVIPYKFSERKSKFSLAFQELEYYIKKYSA